MKILDRYITKQFVLTFIFAVIAFILIFILIDFIEKVDDFIDRKATTLNILEYYLYTLPEIVKLITPMSVLLASLFVTGRLTQQTELTAMKASGISLYRIFLPFLIVALTITAISIYFSGWVLPHSAKAKARFEATVLGKTDFAGNTSANLFIQESISDDVRRIVSIGYYDDSQKSGYTVSIQRFTGEELITRLDAKKMTFNPETKYWKLDEVFERKFAYSSPKTPASYRTEILSYKLKDSLALSFTDAELHENNAELDMMTIPEHRRFIIAKQRAGFEKIDEAIVKYYTKFSFPIASIIVAIIGVTLSSVKKRGGLALEFGICLLLGFVYIGFQETSATLGYNGSIPPIIAAWFANLLFLSGAVWLMIKTPK